MDKLTPNMPLDGMNKSWLGISIKEYYMGELVAIAVKQTQETAFAKVFKKAYGASPPAPNHIQDIDDGFAFWTGQGQYMLLLSGENIQADVDCAAMLGGTAYATLQSDGWASFDIIGDKAFDILERFIPLDLRRAPHGFATRTVAHHIAAIVLKFSDTEIQLLTPRSSAQSFWDGLTHIVDLYFEDNQAISL